MPDIQATPFVPGSATGILHRGHANAPPGCICILTQAELAHIPVRPAGIIVIDGALFSHAMIRLLVWGIPTVMIPAQMQNQLVPGAAVFIDGRVGRIIQPPKASVAKAALQPLPAALPLYLGDHSEVMLRASIIDAEDARHAVERGAAAIGLVRTEFLIPASGAQPDAAFYEQTLRQLCRAAHPLAVTLRLPDIAADKPVPWMATSERIHTPLGLQGVRLFDQEPVYSVVMAMLDAVNRLADDYALGLLLPHVTRLDEFQRWRASIGQRLQKSVAIGAMLESPAAVLALPYWFEQADFVSIGCNDLMQSLFAADRDLAEMRVYLDAYSPELFRFLQQAAVAAGNSIDRVQLCGLLPQMPGVLPVLIGMGYRVFAVAPVMLPYLASSVQNIDLAPLKGLSRQVCAAKDSHAVKDLLQGL